MHLIDFTGAGFSFGYWSFWLAYEMVFEEIILSEFEDKEFEINGVVYSSKGMLVEHIFVILIHVVVAEKITSVNRR